MSNNTMNPLTVRTTDEKLGETSTQVAASIPSNVSYQTNVTVITAFIDIGKFRKGHGQAIRTRHKYFKWATTFGFLLNPLVVYTDTDLFSNFMLTLRENLTVATKIVRLERNSSWAFRRKDKYENIFSIKDYPQHNPGTTTPEYVCAVHFKYEAMGRASTENYFHTKYFAWIDIGAFRHETESKQYFLLGPPPDFNQSRVAVDQVEPPSFDKDISVIVKQKLDWICGCIFIGERSVLIKFAEQYKRAVDYLITQNLMHQDQQILHAMYSNSGRNAIKPEIDVQTYSRPPGVRYSRWFYLGYIMRKIIE